jgi:hypothetical protein
MPCYVRILPSPTENALLCEASCSGTRAARVRLALARLVYGIVLLAFALWSWAEYSSASSFGDGYGSVWRTAAQLTNWALALTVAWFALAGLCGLFCIERALCNSTSCCAPTLLILFAVAFCFQFTADVLFWATSGTSQSIGGFTGSSIVKHTQILPLLLDVACSRVITTSATFGFVLATYLAYILVAGIYVATERRGPYSALHDEGTGATVAAIFVGLGTLIVSFALLLFLQWLRERHLLLHAAPAAAVGAPPASSTTRAAAPTASAAPGATALSGA